MAKKRPLDQASRSAAVSATTAPPAVPLAAAPSSPVTGTTPPTSLTEPLKTSLGLGWVLVPAVLALLVTLPTLAGDFACDDLQQVAGNPLVAKLGNLPAAFTSGVWRFAPPEVSALSRSYYRPLFSTLLMIGNTLFGSSPWGWHLIIVLLHTAAAAMVYVVVKDLFGKRELALGTASLFAVLPVHAEAVAWVSGGVEVLTALLLLAAFHFYMRYRGSPRLLHLGLALTCYLLALWTKEAALAFPFLVAYTELADVGQSPASESARAAGKSRRLAALALSMGLVTILYAVMRFLANRTLLASEETRSPFLPALQTIPLAIIKYIGLLVWPFGYSFQHDTPLVTSGLGIRFLIPAAVLFTGVFLIVRYAPRELRFSAAWLILTLAPVLVALNRLEIEHLVQERYLYLPSVGFCLAAAYAVGRLAGGARFQARAGKLAFLPVVVLIVFWGAEHVIQARSWHDSLSVYRRAVTVTPESAAAHSALSVWYAAAGRPRDAEAEARRAVELDPQYINGNLQLAYLTLQQGKADRAIAMLEQVRSRVPLGPATRTELATLELNLGRLYSQKQDYERAVEYAQRSLDLWPRTAALYYKALILFNAGRAEESLPLYQETMRRLPPQYAAIHLSIGAVYERLYRLEEARAEYLNYLNLALPESPDIKAVQAQLKDLNEKLQKTGSDKAR